MSSQLFRIRKQLVGAKKDIRRSLEGISRYPTAERNRIKKDLERGFRADMAQMGVQAKDIDFAADQLFRPKAEDNNTIPL